MGGPRSKQSSPNQARFFHLGCTASRRRLIQSVPVMLAASVCPQHAPASLHPLLWLGKQMVPQSGGAWPDSDANHVSNPTPPMFLFLESEPHTIYLISSLDLDHPYPRPTPSNPDDISVYQRPSLSWELIQNILSPTHPTDLISPSLNFNRICLYLFYEFITYFFHLNTCFNEHVPNMLDVKLPEKRGRPSRLSIGQFCSSCPASTSGIPTGCIAHLIISFVDFAIF